MYGYGMGMGHGFLAGLSAIAIFWVVLTLFIAGLVLAFSAKLVGIKDVSILGAIVAIIGGGILGAIAGGIVALVFAMAGPMGTALGWLAFVVTYVWVIKVVFHTSWIRAFFAWVLAIIVEVAVLIVLGVLGVAAFHLMV